MKKFKLSIKQEAEMCLKYIKGDSTKEISIEYNISTPTVINYLNRNNIKILKPITTNDYKELIINLYLNENKDIVSIGKEIGFNSATIYKSLKKWKVKIKDASEVRQIFNINQDYFSNIDTEGKAYFLGLLYADGCMVSNRYAFTISLQEKDKFILEDFKKELNYSGNLKFINYKIKKESYSNQYNLRISNKKLYTDLIKLGLIPKKSLILNFPTKEQVPEYLIHHFIRGYFDGDGSVSISPNGQRFISMLGTFEFLTEVKNIFENLKLIRNKNKLRRPKQYQNNTYIYKVGGNRQILPLIEFLYKDSTYFLKRKKEKLK